MDVVTIERDFLGWIAEKLSLEVDKNIFRGGIPEGINNAVGVVFGSENPSTGFYGFRPRTWNVQLLAKFDSRDAAMIFQSCVTGLFPQPGFTFNDTSFRAITMRGSSEVFWSTDNGVENTCVTVNLLAVVLTSGVQVK